MKSRIIRWVFVIGMSFAAVPGSAQDLNSALSQPDSTGAPSTASPAMATDYRCLNSCVNGGGSGRACLDNCRYTPHLAAHSAPHSFSRNPFTSLIPLGDTLLVTPSVPLGSSSGTPSSSLAPTSQPLGPSTNFRCVSDCQKSGMMHDYCVAHCSY